MSDSVPVAQPGARGAKGDVESPGVLDRILNVFADVRDGEGVTAILLMLNIFLLLAAYYLLKTIREPFILSQPGGAEVKSYSAAAIAGILIVVVPIYSAVAARVSRVKLISGVTLVFIACLAGFFLADKAGIAVGVPFFIWVGIFNLVVIAQAWAFANDVYTVEQGKRLFAIVGFGASLGAIAGAFATGKLVERFGPDPFLLAAAGLLAMCMALTNWINARERRSAAGRPETPGDVTAAQGGPAAPPEAGARGKSGFALVLSNRYLLLIAVLMVLANLVNTTGEYILSKTVVGVAAASHGGAPIDEEKVIGAFYGNFFTVVNIVSALVQAFVVSRVIRYFGVRVGLLVLPLVALLGYASMAFVPVLGFIRTAKIAENSIDYSLQNTARNALYLPTSQEAKYKAKQANDTFFVRFGDVLSAGLVFVGTTWLSFAPRQFALLCLALILVWLVVAWFLGIRFRSLAKTS